MDTKKLRQKILDLAIHGKLVPQDPNDEPASVLLERIRAEKEQLIKEGKIKAPKKSKSAGDTSHYPKEGPWEVPEGWVWTTLDKVCSIRGGKRIPKGKTFAKERTAHLYIRVTDMKNMTVDTCGLKYIDDEVYDEINSYIIEKNDLYLTIAGTIGKVGTIPEELHGMNLTENAARLTDIVCDKLYLMYALQTDVAQTHFSLRFHQVAQPKLSIETASSTPIALPPLPEQKRIVSVIETLLTCIHTIEEEQQELETNTEKTKSRILDLAIHGKLVPQDPSDEPAIELLKRINPGFEPSDNLHYGGALPVGWELCRLEDILEYEQPQAYIVKSTNYSNQYVTPVLTPGKSFVLGYTNESDGIYNALPVIIFDDFTTESKYVDFPFKVKSSAMKILRAKGEIDIRYVAFFMSITRLACDTHKRYWISEYSKICIPIPPIQEQKRIVAKIKELNMQLDLLFADTQ